MTDKPTARISFDSWQEFARFLTQKESTSGLFVRMANPPATGTELHVQLHFPDASEVDLDARVVHVATQDAPQGSGIGVQLTSMSAPEARALQIAIKRASVAANGGDPQRPPQSAARAPSPAQAPAAGGGQTATPQPSRFAEVTRFLETSKYDRAEDRIRQILAEAPRDREALVLQLIIQARRHRSQFSFEEAIEKYRAVLLHEPEHEEAVRELLTLAAEADRSRSLLQRVFGDS